MCLTIPTLLCLRRIKWKLSKSSLKRPSLDQVKFMGNLHCLSVFVWYRISPRDCSKDQQAKLGTPLTILLLDKIVLVPVNPLPLTQLQSSKLGVGEGREQGERWKYIEGLLNSSLCSVTARVPTWTRINLQPVTAHLGDFHKNQCTKGKGREVRFASEHRTVSLLSFDALLERAKGCPLGSPYCRASQSGPTLGGSGRFCGECFGSLGILCHHSEFMGKGKMPKVLAGEFFVPFKYIWLTLMT